MLKTFTALLAAVALTACTGPKGADGAAGQNGSNGSNGTNGAPGQNGSNGSNGTNGISVGTIAGTVTYADPKTGAQVAADGVTVTPAPLPTGLTAPVTAADGTYSMTVPIGTYTLTFSSPNYTTKTLAGVSVIAGQAAPGAIALVRNNPLSVKITSTAALAPTGFGTSIPLTAAVTGGGANLSYAWSFTGPTAPSGALSATNTANVTFNMDTLANLLAAGAPLGSVNGPLAKIPNFSVPAVDGTADVPKPRLGFVPVSYNQLAKMGYAVKVVVTDTDKGWTATGTATLTPATLFQAMPDNNNTALVTNVPVGTLVIGAGATAASYNWAFTATPSGSAAVLNDATTATPWFIADLPGTYTIADSANGNAALTANANTFIGFSAANCTLCHTSPGAISPRIATQVDKWTNSAHADYYQTSSVKNAPGFVRPSWAPESIFQAGISGDLGGGYSSVCMQCHTVGFNSAATAVNGGFDDMMKTDAWTFPAIPQPVSGVNTHSDANWNNLPANLKNLAGIQCELCHGPNNTDSTASFPGNPQSIGNSPGGAHTAVVSFSAYVCAQCHDAPTHHDKFPMWAESGHSNRSLPVRGAIDRPGSAPATMPNYPSWNVGDALPPVQSSPTAYAAPGAASCARCHTAQGFVAWQKTLQLGWCADAVKGVVPYSCYINDPDQPKPVGPPVGAAMALPPAGQSTAAGTLPNVTTYTNFLISKGLTLSKVEPQTCQACHDPHAAETRYAQATDNGGLGDTYDLPSGFRVKGAGSGSVCFVCHEARNGARNDTLPDVNYPLASFVAPTNFGGQTYLNAVASGAQTKYMFKPSIATPHDSTAADVMAGKNAFFVAGSPSRHMAVKDTCAGCHVNLADSSGSTTGSPNHTFKVDNQLCASCHSSNVDGEASQAAFDAALADSIAAVGTAAYNYLTSSAVGGTIVFHGSKQDVSVATSNIVSIVGGGSTGSTLQFTFATAINNPNASSGTVTTLSFSYTSIWNAAKTDLVFSPTGLIARAAWNNLLLANELSHGIHNPSFEYSVINATKAALLTADPLASPVYKNGVTTVAAF